MLGRHVGNGSERRTGTCEVLRGGSVPRSASQNTASRRSGYFGQTKIHQLGLTAVRYKNVGWLDITVNDSFGVSGIESIDDLNAEIQNQREFERAAGNAVAQCLSFQQLHGDKCAALMLTDLKDGANVGVIERRSGARLPLETF